MENDWSEVIKQANDRITQLQEYNLELKSENASLRARLDKAVEFAEYVNNQFGYCMPQGFFTKYDELIAKAPSKLEEMKGGTL